MNHQKSVVARVLSILALIVVLFLGIYLVRSIIALGTPGTTDVMPTIVAAAVNPTTAVSDIPPVTNTLTSSSMIPLPAASDKEDETDQSLGPFNQVDTVVSAPDVVTDINDLSRGAILYLTKHYGQGPQVQARQLRLITPDGNNQWLLAEDLARNTALLDWSHHDQLALLSDDREGTYLIRTDGSQEKIVLSSQPAITGRWSPTGGHVGVVYWDELSLVDIISGEEQTISLPLAVKSRIMDTFFRVGSVGGISWSPDGDWFAFQVSGYTADNQEAAGLFRYDLTSGQIETLYLDKAFTGRIRVVSDNLLVSLPAVSPDGTVIITDLGGEHGLFTLAVGGDQLTSLFRSYLPVMEPPRWSPDGQWLAALYLDDIYLFSMQGDDVRNLTQSPHIVEKQVSWSPDSRQLVYATETSPGVKRIVVHDIFSNEIRYLTNIRGNAELLAASFPIWSPISSEQLIQLRENVPSLDMLEYPQESMFRLMGRPEELDRLPVWPPLAMDPPWWNNRYFLRQPLQLSTPVPIKQTENALVYPPLAQLIFDSATIEDQLYYPSRGYDIGIAWWGGPETGWRELPHAIHGLDSDQTIITFPLQESIEEISDAYYLYYGSFYSLQLWETVGDLNEVSLGHPESLRWSEMNSASSLLVAQVQPLLPDRYLDVHGDVTWPVGSFGRPVVQLASDQAVSMPANYDRGQGSLSLFVQPAAVRNPGVLLTLAEQQYNFPGPGQPLVDERGMPLDFEPEEKFFPLLQYDGINLRLSVDDTVLTAPWAATTDQWVHIAATWLSHDQIRLYVNGEVVAESPYQSSGYQSEHFLPEGRTYYQVYVGAAGEETGLAGQYFNLYTLADSLTPAEVHAFFHAQWSLQVTLSDRVTNAVTTAMIDPETGGQLRSPDGQVLVEFPPNSVAEPTMVSFLGVNRGQSRPDLLTRFMLYPGDLRHLSVSDEMVLYEIEETFAAEHLSIPMQIYYYYDLALAEDPLDINFAYFDEVQLEWVPFRSQIHPDQEIIVITDPTRWGTYIVLSSWNSWLRPR